MNILQLIVIPANHDNNQTICITSNSLSNKAAFRIRNIMIYFIAKDPSESMLF